MAKIYRPPKFIVTDRDPTLADRDSYGFVAGDKWVNTSKGYMYHFFTPYAFSNGLIFLSIKVSDMTNI